VQKANSGHPGAPMGMKPWLCSGDRFLKLNPETRHGLIETVLSFQPPCLGYVVFCCISAALRFDRDLKNFRTGAVRPGAPEYGLTPCVEGTTAAGQGFANGSVWLCGKVLSERDNRPLQNYRPLYLCLCLRRGQDGGNNFRGAAALPDTLQR
jgi:transketolase